jgi:hypothetical protein
VDSQIGLNVHTLLINLYATFVKKYGNNYLIFKPMFLQHLFNTFDVTRECTCFHKLNIRQQTLLCLHHVWQATQERWFALVLGYGFSV